jgi:hypothetical protein
MYEWFFKKWLPEHPGCALEFNEIKENPPHKLLGVSLQKYLNSLDEFRLSALYRRMSPVKEIKDWFIRHGVDYRHIALTAVPLAGAASSAEWVFRHFGTWIRVFCFVPSKRKKCNIPDYDKDKGAFLKRLGSVDLFIDDNAENIKLAQAAGVKCILISKPWNKAKDAIGESLRLIEKENKRND